MVMTAEASNNRGDIWASRSLDPTHLILHATAVAAGGRALVLAGPSGVGKTSVALQLMTYGATLISDDMLLIQKAGGGVKAAAPPQAPAQIELRHIGPCPAVLGAASPVLACVDLRPTDLPRLPQPAYATLLGCRVPLIQTSREGPFAPALWHYLTHVDPGTKP